MVEDGNTIASVAKEIGIKYSTAKLIFKRYRETGTFYESRTMKGERRLREAREDSSARGSPYTERRVGVPRPVTFRSEPGPIVPVCEPVTPITPTSPFAFPQGFPMPYMWVYPFPMI